jgi:hypothetical protein
MRTSALLNRIRRTILLTTMLALLLPFAGAQPAGAAPRTFYLSTGGNDGNPGTVGAPWRTFTSSLPKLQPGDLLLVRGGTYVERFNLPVFHNPASAGSPIVVRAYPGERPVVRGLMNIRGASYWTFDGINVTWDGATPTSDPLVRLMNGVGWTFTNAEVWNSHARAGIIVGSSVSGEPSNWTLRGNCVHDTRTTDGVNTDHNLYLAGGDFGPGLVERNILFNATNGENIKLGGSTPSSRGTGHVEVRYNTMYNGGQNMVVPWKSHHNTIEWNLMGKAVGKSWYPNLRGYALTGADNVAHDNAGFAAARFLLNTDSSSTRVSYGVADRGGNRFPVAPAFDGAGCGGFFPQDWVSREYGRYAAGAFHAGAWAGGGSDTPGRTFAGTWSLRNSTTSGPPDIGPFGYGRPTDLYVTGDWNGDGVDTIGVYQGGVWKLRNGAGPGSPDVVVSYGGPADRPIVGDWNGDGVDTIGIVRGNVIKERNSNSPGAADATFSFGRATDVFVSGDWNGDGTETIGIYRLGWWFMRNTNSAGSPEISFGFGGSHDRAVVGDFNGDGVDTVGVVRDDLWLLRNANAPGNPDVTPFTFAA